MILRDDGHITLLSLDLVEVMAPAVLHDGVKLLGDSLGCLLQAGLLGNGVLLNHARRNSLGSHSVASIFFHYLIT